MSLKQLIGLQSSNLSVRELRRALGLSVGAVSKYLRALRACGIGATEAAGLPEVELEREVFGITMPAKATTWEEYTAAHGLRRTARGSMGELKRHRHVRPQLRMG
jgi:hypothetical protein